MVRELEEEGTEKRMIEEVGVNQLVDLVGSMSDKEVEKFIVDKYNEFARCLNEIHSMLKRQRARELVG